MNTSSDRYDRLTRTFHWLTAAVVVFLRRLFWASCYAGLKVNPSTFSDCFLYPRPL
ncbi:hypothetical protein [Pseudomonas gelidaquae]|uniref:hypothetical protein n=1 Tax=Pseudomonas sp. IB20 TaxID=1702250 RepID=UPI002113EE4B|nr:hypothetical protein [Pseudomonas sp. IB20]